MEKELSFERKISFEPLLISIFFGIIVTTIIYSIFPNYPLIGIVSGCGAFAIESLLIYPRYLAKSYGYWRLDSIGIHYYDYSTWGRRIQAIFFPLRKGVLELPYSDIKTFSVVDDKSIMNTQNPLGGSLNMPMARKVYYLLIKTDHQEIRLNCAWKSSGLPMTATDIKKITELINSRM